MILAPVRLDTNHDKNNPDMSIISDTSILNRGCDISTVNSYVSPTYLSPSNDNHILLSRVGSANPISPEITHCAFPEREGASLVSQNILNIDMDNYDNVTDSISHSHEIHASPNVSTSESQDSPLPGSSSYTVLNDLRVKNVNRIMFAHININSVRNKFEMIADLVDCRPC